MWKVPKNIICKKQSYINKLPDVFIDIKREYEADELTEGLNTFSTNIGSNLAKRITLQRGTFFDTLLKSNCNSTLLSQTDGKITLVTKFSNKSSLDCKDMSMTIIFKNHSFCCKPLHLYL